MNNKEKKLRLKIVFIASIFTIFFSLPEISLSTVIINDTSIPSLEEQAAGQRQRYIQVGGGSVTGSRTNSSGLYRGQYVPLEPIPGTGGAATPADINSYIRTLFNLGIIIATLGAVFMIALGGFQYMGSDVAGQKSAGKQKITNAIYGLILALASWLILQTINPQINLGRSATPTPTPVTVPAPATNISTPTNNTVDTTPDGIPLPNMAPRPVLRSLPPETAPNPTQLPGPEAGTLY